MRFLRSPVMHTLPVTVALIFLFQVASAQDDDTVRYIHGLPVTGEDTLSQRDTVDQLPRDILIPVPANEIPRHLQKTLKDDQYEGWENSGVLLQRNTGLYVVRIAAGETTTTYLFTRKGRVVSFGERTNRQR